MLKYSVGLDISASTFNACFSVIDATQKVTAKASRKFPNNRQGFSGLVEWVQKYSHQKVLPLVITMEATGVYYEMCASYLVKKGYSVAVVLPNKAKKYLQAAGLKSKNDSIDAQGLARMGAEQSLEPWSPMEEYFYQLRSLTRQHQSLQELKTNIGNQLHADESGMYQNKLVAMQLKKLINTLDAQLSTIEKAINEHILSSKEISAKVEKICKIKGVGVLTVAIVLARNKWVRAVQKRTPIDKLCRVRCGGKPVRQPHGQNQDI